MDETAQTSLTTSICSADVSMLNCNVSHCDSPEDSVISLTDDTVADCSNNLDITISEQEREWLKKCNKQAALSSISMDAEGTQLPGEAAQSEESTLQEQPTSPTRMDEEQSLDTVMRIPLPVSPHLTNTVEENAELTMHITGVSSAQSNNYERDFFRQPIKEVARRCWPSTPDVQKYTKGCLWSPDGTCLLVPVHMDGMHVVELPTDLYHTLEVAKTRALSDCKSAVHIPEGGTVYDCAWYPLMHSADPDTCFWIATRQHEPIHMWDAFDGHLRGSYIGYDAADEAEAAISVAFSQYGEKIYAGYKRNIKIFDSCRPGRSYDTYPVKRAISCIAQTQDNTHTLTCGNWHGYIQHYDLRSPKLGALFTLGGHSGGITHLRYAERESWQLFSGARKDNKILQWDMRHYSSPVATYSRNVSTNQRIYFDLSPQQTWLASGDTDGKLRIWQLDGEEGENETLLAPQVHGDCLNGVNFHPMRPILATSSGQYHFLKQTQAMHDSDSEHIVDYENALLLLWCGQITSTP